MDLKNLQRSDFKFWTKIETRWSDLDVIGHLNHTVYLSYMESSRVELYASLGYPGINRDMDESAILASLNIQYISQLSHPSSIDIGNKISRIGNKSYDITSAIFQQNKSELVCSATFHMVAFNYKLNKAIKVPELIIKHYKKGNG